MLVAALAVLAGCAAPLALDATDGVYALGHRSFDAGRCAEARETLTAFMRSSCMQVEPASGCQRAAWMKMQCALKDDHPALAMVDAAAPGAGPPRPELEPSTEALRQKARAILDARWETQQRPAKLDVALFNELPKAYRLVSVDLTLDGRLTPPLPVAEPFVEPFVEVLAFVMDVPAGDHVLSMTAVVEFGNRVSGQYRMVMKSSQAVAVREGERAHIVAKTQARKNAPPLALPPERIAEDFVVTPETARER
jgi:hypothetical protein